VRLAPDVRDAAGVSVAELSGGIHPETIRTAELVQREAARWLEASGAERVWTLPIRRGMTVAHHQAGTCRMSSDPADGVTDTTGRVHGHDNLFVADASVHVTNGSFNPTLTTMALAMRTADEVIAQHA
jgi:choline dehydrogenase-like flavoprotein